MDMETKGNSGSKKIDENLQGGACYSEFKGLLNLTSSL